MLTPNLDMMEEQNWFVFVCENGRVELAQEWFEHWTKCECYYPVAKLYVYPKRNRTDAPRIVERPALGLYLFVRFFERVYWQIIREQNCHVQRWLRVFNPLDESYYPAVVRDREILELRRLEAKGSFDDASPEQKDKILSKALRGLPVRIPYGPYCGASGAAFHEVNGCLVRIKLKMLGKDIYLSFPIAEIFPEFDKNIC